MAANIVRTVLSTAAVAALARAIFLQGRRATARKAAASAGGPAWAPPAPTIAAAQSPSTDPTAVERPAGVPGQNTNRVGSNWSSVGKANARIGVSP